MDKNTTINTEYNKKLIDSMNLVLEEVQRAKSIHKTNFNSNHEALAIIEEEFLELRDEIFWGEKKYRKISENNSSNLEFNPMETTEEEIIRIENYSKEIWNRGRVMHNSAMKEEAVQLAAMCLRFLSECV